MKTATEIVNKSVDTRPVLEVTDLNVELPIYGHYLPVVTNISFQVRPGEAVALVGESGCGKTMTARSIIGLPPDGARVSGSIKLEGRELTTLSKKERRKLGGSRIGFIFQEPMTSLHPTLTVGAQLCDTLRLHLGLDNKAARARAAELLDRVGIPRSKAILDTYVHQLSGGMRQRVMIALAVSCGPALVIADEPTTALDVTIQAQVLDLLDEMRKDLGLSMLYITHDLEVVGDFCDRAVVMYAGDVVEEGPALRVLQEPYHHYTNGLVGAIPVLEDQRTRLTIIPGQVPPLGAWPSGCRFAPRCTRADQLCQKHPGLEDFDQGRLRCWHPVEYAQTRKEVSRS
ncbi:MAG TPA: ABC transporter ATP-binding protein [Chloroflexia bacterium]|nr:ABC transporter ATP-binding protein [Chloroflexia bacterium]